MKEENIAEILKVLESDNKILNPMNYLDAERTRYQNNLSWVIIKTGQQFSSIQTYYQLLIK